MEQRVLFCTGWYLWLSFLPLLTRKRQRHLLLGTQKSNGNMGASKAPPALHAFTVLTRFFTGPRPTRLQGSKAQGGGCSAKGRGCRASVSGCGARVGGCRAVPRFSLPRFRSEGQKETGNLCREGAAWLAHLHLNPHNALPATHSHSIVVLLAEIWEHAQRVRQLLDALSCFLFEL